MYNSNNETTSFHTSKRLQHHLRMFIAFPNFRFANLPTNLSLCLPCAFYIYWSCDDTASMSGSCHPTGGDVRYCYLPVSDRQIIWTWGWRIVVCFMGLAKSHHLIGLLSNRNTVNMVEWHQQFLVWFTLPSVSSFFTTVSLFDLRSLAPRWYHEYLKA